MNSKLKEIRDSVIEHTLKLDNDQLALLLLIQLSRHQNLFIHEQSDWEDSPTGWITNCLLYTSPSPRDLAVSRMPSSA